MFIYEKTNGFLKKVPECAKFQADVTIGLYKEKDQLVKLIQEGKQYYRQIHGSPKQLISQERFQHLWNRHDKIRIVKTVFACEQQDVTVLRYHACLEGLIVARGGNIPAHWPRAENLDFQVYAKNIPNFREWKDFLF